jgi:ribosomal-protein-alanine N-acetyltransferase
MNLILKTKRLTLRPLLISDRDAMVDVIMSDMDVMYWLPVSGKVLTIEGQQAVALDYLTDFTESWDEFGFGGWAICVDASESGASGGFAGYCAFIPEQIEGAGPELAYAVGKSMWGRGLVTEALTACMDWVFNTPGIVRVYAVTDNENTASRRVMEKLGMIYEKDVDLYNASAGGNGLLPYYSVEREAYLQKREIETKRS